MSPRIWDWLAWTVDDETHPARVLITYALAGMLPASLVLVIYSLGCVAVGEENMLVIDLLLFGALSLLFYLNRRGWWKLARHALLTVILLGGATDPQVFGVAAALVIAVAGLYNLTTSVLFIIATIVADRIVYGRFGVWHSLTYLIAGVLFYLLGRLNRRYYRQVEESEERYRGIVEDTPVLVCRFLTDGEITFANRAYGEYFDKKPEELIGSNFQAVIPEAEREAVMVSIAELAVESPARSVEHRVTMPDGEIRWQRWTSRALFDAAGEVIAYQSIGEDVTERVEAEEALQAYSERLEEMVEERTQELYDAQERLLEQEKLATLGQLAGAMAHELNNPLGGMKNAAYFLDMVLGQPEPEVAEALEIIEREMATCARIVNSLLEFTRTNPPVRRQVDLNDVVREALSRAAVPERIAVVRQLDGSLPPVLADRDQLGQVFDNLLLNAIQAMSPPYVVKESGQLTVASRAIDAEWVAVSIADTGVGIAEENLERIFEPLFTTKAKGIGLGLALVKTLVEGHGGAIEVESPSTKLNAVEPLRTGAVGEGSTFTVRLPVE